MLQASRAETASTARAGNIACVARGPGIESCGPRTVESRFGGGLMIRIDGGTSRPYCDGLSRRSFVKVGVAGMASVGLPALLRAREEARAARLPAKSTSVILIWLDGGPSHMDLYDLKPEAPSEYRGIWKPLKTNVPGIEI